MKKLCFALLLLSGCSSDENERKAVIEKLDREIEKTRDEIRTEEIKALDKDVESQGYMREDYSKFAETLEKSEASEERAKELEGHLLNLEQRKSALEKHQ